MIDELDLLRRGNPVPDEDGIDVTALRAALLWAAIMRRRGQTVHLQTFTMWCRDWHATRAFYVDLLGLPVQVEEDGRFCVVDAGGTTLCIDAAHGKPVTTGQLIFRVEDPTQVRRRAEAVDYPVREAPGYGADSVVLTDPDGREVVVQQAE